MSVQCVGKLLFSSRKYAGSYGFPHFDHAVKEYGILDGRISVKSKFFKLDLVKAGKGKPRQLK